MADKAPPEGGKGGGVKKYLFHKVGPLPLIVWVGAGAAVGFLFLRSRSGGGGGSVGSAPPNTRIPLGSAPNMDGGTIAPGSAAPPLGAPAPVPSVGWNDGWPSLNPLPGLGGSPHTGGTGTGVAPSPSGSSVPVAPPPPSLGGGLGMGNPGGTPLPATIQQNIGFAQNRTLVPASAQQGLIIAEQQRAGASPSSLAQNGAPMPSAAASIAAPAQGVDQHLLAPGYVGGSWRDQQ